MLPLAYRATRGAVSLAALVLVALVATPLAAQPGAPAAAEVMPGTRVRVRIDIPPAQRWLDNDMLVGSLARLDADSVIVRTDTGTVAIARSRMRALAVHAGRRSVLESSLRGAEIGALTGIVAGLAFGAIALSDRCRGDYCGPLHVAGLLIAPTILAVPGTLAGAVIGGIAATGVGGDRWRDVALAPHLRVGLSLTF